VKIELKITRPLAVVDLIAAFAQDTIRLAVQDAPAVVVPIFLINILPALI
jgi:hypothetical protein